MAEWPVDVADVVVLLSLLRLDMEDEVEESRCKLAFARALLTDKRGGGGGNGSAKSCCNCTSCACTISQTKTVPSSVPAATNKVVGVSLYVVRQLMAELSGPSKVSKHSNLSVSSSSVDSAPFCPRSCPSKCSFDDGSLLGNADAERSRHRRTVRSRAPDTRIDCKLSGWKYKLSPLRLV